MKLSLSGLVLVACVSCASSSDRFDPPHLVSNDAGAGSSAAPEGVVVDEVEIVRGVPDRNRDPAVVALAVGTTGLCTAALVSPRLLLTARHCVSRTVEQVMCPAAGVQILGDHDPKSLAVLVGDDVASARVAARGASLVTPGGVTLCDADIAFVVLDAPVTWVKPLPIRLRGPSKGERLRAVGFGRTHDGGPAGQKLVREHVRVLSVTHAEFAVGEATCQGDSGGPALDEETGEIAGVVSRGGPSCEGPGVHNLYTRADAFSWLVEEAFARAAGVDRGADAGAGTPAPKGTKQKPPSDVGGPCETGSDCAAGVCVTDGERKYCSRPCGTGDRCPTRYNCKAMPSGSSACINVR
jgi:hypothetical protein